MNRKQRRTFKATIKRQRAIHEGETQATFEAGKAARMDDPQYRPLCLQMENEWHSYLRETIGVDTTGFASSDEYIPELGITHRHIFYPSLYRQRFHQWLDSVFVPNMARLDAASHGLSYQEPFTGSVLIAIERGELTKQEIIAMKQMEDDYIRTGQMQEHSPFYSSFCEALDILQRRQQ